MYSHTHKKPLSVCRLWDFVTASLKWLWQVYVYCNKCPLLIVSRNKPLDLCWWYISYSISLSQKQFTLLCILAFFKVTQIEGSPQGKCGVLGYEFLKDLKVEGHLRFKGDILSIAIFLFLMVFDNFRLCFVAYILAIIFTQLPPAWVFVPNTWGGCGCSLKSVTWWFSLFVQ